MRLRSLLLIWRGIAADVTAYTKRKAVCIATSGPKSKTWLKWLKCKNPESAAVRWEREEEWP